MTAKPIPRPSHQEFGLASTVLSSTESPKVAAAKPKPITNKFVMIDNYLIDVTLSEDHKFESEVTEYPVESGTSVSDNIRPKPITITMEGLVSNTPLAAMASSRNARPPAENALLALGAAGAAGALRRASSGVKTSAEAYAHLLKIYERREPVTIRTSLGSFENMALESINFPRSSGEHDGLRFSASFKQIKIVKNKRVKVAIPIAEGGGGKPTTTTKPPAVSDIGTAALVNTREQTWYDADISGWRERAGINTQQIGNALVPINSPGQNKVKYTLVKGRPLSVTRAQWARWINPPAPLPSSSFSSNPNFIVLDPTGAGTSPDPDFSDPSVKRINDALNLNTPPDGVGAPNVIVVEAVRYQILRTTRNV